MQKELKRLVLRRKPGQALWIGGARVMVNAKHPVQYMIDAPEEIKVLREELKEPERKVA